MSDRETFVKSANLKLKEEMLSNISWSSFLLISEKFNVSFDEAYNIPQTSYSVPLFYYKSMIKASADVAPAKLRSIELDPSAGKTAERLMRYPSFLRENVKLSFEEIKKQEKSKPKDNLVAIKSGLSALKERLIDKKEKAIKNQEIELSDQDLIHYIDYGTWYGHQLNRLSKHDFFDELTKFSTQETIIQWLSSPFPRDTYTPLPGQTHYNYAINHAQTWFEFMVLSKSFNLQETVENFNIPADTLESLLQQHIIEAAGLPQWMNNHETKTKLDMLKKTIDASHGEKKEKLSIMLSAYQQWIDEYKKVGWCRELNVDHISIVNPDFVTEGLSDLQRQELLKTWSFKQSVFNHSLKEVKKNKSLFDKAAFGAWEIDVYQRTPKVSGSSSSLDKKNVMRARKKYIVLGVSAEQFLDWKHHFLTALPALYLPSFKQQMAKVEIKECLQFLSCVDGDFFNPSWTTQNIKEKIHEIDPCDLVHVALELAHLFPAKNQPLLGIAIAQSLPYEHASLEWIVDMMTVCQLYEKNIFATAHDRQDFLRKIEKNNIGSVLDVIMIKCVEKIISEQTQEIISLEKIDQTLQLVLSQKKEILEASPNSLSDLVHKHYQYQQKKIYWMDDDNDNDKINICLSGADHSLMKELEKHAIQHIRAGEKLHPMVNEMSEILNGISARLRYVNFLLVSEFGEQMLQDNWQGLQNMFKGIGAFLSSKFGYQISVSGIYADVVKKIVDDYIMNMRQVRGMIKDKEGRWENVRPELSQLFWVMGLSLKYKDNFINSFLSEVRGYHENVSHNSRLDIFSSLKDPGIVAELYQEIKKSKGKNELAEKIILSLAIQPVVNDKVENIRQKRKI